MVTATQISSYMYCPRKLFISDVLDVKEPPKDVLIRGLVWHQTYQILNARDEKIVRSLNSKNYDDIFEKYKREYAKFLRDSIIRNKSALKKFDISMIELFKEYWPHFELEAKSHAINVHKFAEKHDVLGKELWEGLTPKIISEQFVQSEKYNLSGVIDMTEIHAPKMEGSAVHTKEEIYVPVELKTGKVPSQGIWDTHKMQLAAYMTILEDSGKKVVEGVMRYKGAEDRIVQFNQTLKEEVLDFVHQVERILSLNVPPSRIENSNKCKRCSFQNICYDDEKMASLVERKFSKGTIAE